MNLSEPVLVLNCAWQAISVITVETALANTYRGAMTPIDTDTMTPLKWEHWATLPVRESDKFIRTVHGMIRIPLVVCASKYAGMPKKMPKLNTKNIAKRDKRICQYSGEYAPDGTVDHIVPISRNGAKKSWENMVWCKKEINTRKGNQLNENIGLKLIRTPKAPRPGVAMQSIEPLRPEWQPFLIHGNANMQSVA